MVRILPGMADVSIVAARPEWSHEFAVVADELSKLAADSIVGIFHVGSTSYAAFKLKAAVLLAHDSGTYVRPDLFPCR